MSSTTAVKRIRVENQRKVLSIVMDSHRITRTDVSKLAGVSLMTISNIADDLMRASLLKESKYESSIGRTPNVMYFAKENATILIINLTQKTSISYMLFAINKAVLSKGEYTLNPKIDLQTNLLLFTHLIEHQCLSQKLEIIGVGISVPGAYEEQNDHVKTNLLSYYKDFRPHEYFSQAFKCDIVIIAHDVNMAAYAESRSIKGDKAIYYFFVGDGIGGSFIDGQKLLLGKDNLAGDIGQTLISCSNMSEHLEQIASIPSVEARLSAQNLNYSITQIIQGYERGEEKFVEPLSFVIKAISTALFNVMWQYNPDYIVVKSTSPEYEKLIISETQKFIEVKKDLSPDSPARFLTTKIIASATAENPSLYGLFDLVKDAIIEKLISDIN